MDHGAYQVIKQGDFCLLSCCTLHRGKRGWILTRGKRRRVKTKKHTAIFFMSGDNLVQVELYLAFVNWCYRWRRRGLPRGEKRRVKSYRPAAISVHKLIQVELCCFLKQSYRWRRVADYTAEGAVECKHVGNKDDLTMTRVRQS